MNQARIQLAQADSGTMTDAGQDSVGDRDASGGNADVRIDGEIAKTPSENLTKPLSGTAGLLTMSQQFKDAIADVESKTTGEYKARNPDLSKKPWVALGRYQLQLAGLQDAGFIDKKHNWTGPAAQRFGVQSEDDFRNNPPAQEAAFAAFMAKQAAYLKSNGSLSYIGKNVNGIEAPFAITYDGLLAAAHREGAQRVAEYLGFLGVNNFDSHEILELPNFNIMDPDPKRRAKIKRDLETTMQRFINIEKRLRTFANVPFYRRPDDYPLGVH